MHVAVNEENTKPAKRILEKYPDVFVVLVEERSISHLEAFQFLSMEI